MLSLIAFARSSLHEGVFLSAFKSLNGVTVKFKGRLKCQWYFKKISRMYQESFNGVSRKFQRSFKEDSLEMCVFKKVLRLENVMGV